MDDIFKALEKVYGKRSSSGFGSSVFYEISNQEASLASITRDVYKLFMGEKWNPETEATWLSGSKIIYERSPGTAPDIITKLNNIKDVDAKNAFPLLTEFIDNASRERQHWQLLSITPISPLLPFLK